MSSSDDGDDISSSSSSSSAKKVGKRKSKLFSALRKSSQDRRTGGDVREQQRGLLDDSEDAMRHLELDTDELVMPQPSHHVGQLESSPLSASGIDAPFALIGGDTPSPPSSDEAVDNNTPSKTTTPLSTPGRRRHDELIDPHHPLPQSSPPNFVQFPSPDMDHGSNGHVHSSSLLNGVNEFDEHTRWNIWLRRLREFFSYTTWTYYVRHSVREMTKRKCNYCLGLFSVWLVVLVAAVCYTMIARAPVVFLQQAEFNSGQMDLQLRPKTGGMSFFNYTTLARNVDGHGEKEYQYHTARTTYNVIVLPSTNCTREMGDPFEIDWKYVGKRETLTPTTSDVTYPCTNRTLNCIETMCKFPRNLQSEYVPLWTIDTLRERDIGLGRMWPFEEPIPVGHAIVTIDLARQWGVKVGDVVQVRLTRDYLVTLRSSMAIGVEWAERDGQLPTRLNSNATALLDAFASRFGAVTYVPFTIEAILSRTFSKFVTDEDPMLIVEAATFLPWVIKYAHTNLREIKNLYQMADLLIGSSSSSGNKYFEYALYSNVHDLPHSLIGMTGLYPTHLQSITSFTSLVVFNLGEDRRTDIYIDTNYDRMQDTVIEWSSKIIYFASFPQVSSSLPILDEMEKVKMFSLYLGLILSIILTILFLLSMLLIYSLLMISIETRTFELGVHRMCGMTRFNIVKLLIVQAFSFSIPAWILGLTISQIIVAIISAKLEASVEVPLSRLLTGRSIAIASVMGLILPLLASILPIRTALSRNLQDALDTRHSKTLGVEYAIERSVDAGIDGAWMALGVGLAVLGGSIYYLVPLALVSFNLTLFFNIFFALLLGMLLGLILLSLNFQPLIERFLVFTLFWWESRASTFIVLKNLVTHRQRNRKTSIMFALALGFILFITMAFQLELYSAKARTYKSNGGAMVLQARWQGSSGLLSSGQVQAAEVILGRYQPTVIEQWSWVTPRLGWNDEWDDTYMSNLGHAFSNGAQIFGVTSNFYETTLNEYIVEDSDTPSQSSTPLSQQLYTVAGSQAALMGTSNKQQFGLADNDGTKSNYLLALQRRQQDDG